MTKKKNVCSFIAAMLCLALVSPIALAQYGQGPPQQDLWDEYNSQISVYNTRIGIFDPHEEDCWRLDKLAVFLSSEYETYGDPNTGGTNILIEAVNSANVVTEGHRTDYITAVSGFNIGADLCYDAIDDYHPDDGQEAFDDIMDDIETMMEDYNGFILTEGNDIEDRASATWDTTIFYLHDSTEYGYSASAIETQTGVDIDEDLNHP